MTAIRNHAQHRASRRIALASARYRAAMRIQIADSDSEIDDCYAVMAELRPHLAREAFVAQVKRQRDAGSYQLVALHDPDVVAVAGIRIAEWLPSGKSVEIEDLVTRDGARSKGYGAALFDWIADHARREGCVELKLVSHVTRFDAHRFYLNRGMRIVSHFFHMRL